MSGASDEHLAPARHRLFPNADPEARAFFAGLLQILGGLPQADAQPNHIRLMPPMNCEMI
jgi:hypothetical protein